VLPVTKENEGSTTAGKELFEEQIQYHDPLVLSVTMEIFTKIKVDIDL